MARASAAGRSFRAVVRLSGPAVGLALGSLTGSGLGARGVERRCLTNPLGVPCLAYLMPGPASYTGEDTAELHLAGSDEMVRRLLADATSIAGVRLAEPGEFTARAYLAGRLTVEQAEGVAAIIAARTGEQVRAARVLLAGGAGERYRRWTDTAAGLLALVEAGIDFTDQEDVVAITPANLARAIDAILADAADWVGVGQAAAARTSTARPTVALVGPPNAGKSTLFNVLLGRPRAVASPAAGTTRDVLAEALDLSGVSPGAAEVTLMDLPGLDVAPESLAQSEIDRAAQAAARRALAVADVRVQCDPGGRFDAIPHEGTGPVVHVRTQIDRDLKATSTQPDGSIGSSIGVCALDGRGLGLLRRAIADAVWGAGDSPLAAAPRHHRAVSSAVARLQAARSQIDPAWHTFRSPETVAAELRGALDSLGELVGHVTPDEVLGRLFRSFCVGK